MRKNLSRILIKGGVLSPAELKHIVELAENLGLKTISFGSRQDVILSRNKGEQDFEEMNKIRIIPAGGGGNENIVSSYVSADIFHRTSWLTSNRYLYILEQFNYPPNIKINITDPKQRLVPLYTGHLNFIASEHEDYWYLYVRLPDWEDTEMYPVLIFSWDIAKTALEIENILQEEPQSTEMIFDLVNDVLDTNNRTVEIPLEVPFHPFPYYEGMNRLENDSYWLGLYWRNNKYDIEFLKAMCDLCADCKIGKISITPWKSLIIKGIPVKLKLQWEKFLGKFGINVRHSLLELNWHLPVANNEALKLKKYLVSNFNKNDISTYGLTFGITDYVRKAYYFTSIVIEKNKPVPELSGIKLGDTYNVLYAKNFNPNTHSYIAYVQEVDKVELPGLLIELSKMYFEQLGNEQEEAKPLKAKKLKPLEIYQCKDCLTIYDPALGDTIQGIDPDTAFEDLPEDYVCQLCEAHKSYLTIKTVMKELD